MVTTNGNEITVGSKVQNVYGETGTVKAIDETTLWVANDRNTGNYESWHVSKTFAL